MKIEFITPHHKEIGYKVQADIVSEKIKRHFYHDSDWAEFFEMDKTNFIEKLQELGAINYCTKEFPSVYFPTKTLMEKAIEDFYEPMIMAKKLIS